MSMRKVNDLSANSDVLLEIMHKAWDPLYPGCFESVEDIVRYFSIHVKRTCLTLEWLGFLERDDSHGFGYKPTRRLTNRASVSRLLKSVMDEEPFLEDKDFFNCIYEAAVPRKLRGGVDVGFSLEERVLYVLGLVTEFKRDPYDTDTKSTSSRLLCSKSRPGIL